MKPRSAASPRVACYATVPFQLRALEPIARAFADSLVSLDAEQIKQWQPDAIIVTAEHEVTLFRPFCTEHDVALIGLRHGAGNKYTAPCREYTLADYICGSEWDQQDFRRGGIVPLRQFLLTGNPWVDETFRLPPHTLNRECPTILFAPTWNPQTSAAALLEGKLVSLVRRVFPRSRIVIRPHPNIICHDHPYMQKCSALFQRWMEDWRRMVASEPEVELIDDKQLSISHLFADADILISDGSSLIFEFITLDRPILLYTSAEMPDHGQIDPLALGNRHRNIGIEFRTDDEFVSALQEAFTTHAAVCSARQRHLTEELFGRFRDGRSTIRVIDAIRTVLSNPIDKPVRSGATGETALRRAEERLARNDLEGARRCLTEGLAADPHCINLLVALGNTLMRMGNLHFARIELDLALCLDPQFVPALESLAALAIQQHRLEEAANIMRRLITVNPHNLLAWRTLDALVKKDGRLAEVMQGLSTGFVCPVCEHPSVRHLSKSDHPYYVCVHCSATWTPRIDPKTLLTENHSNTSRHQGEIDRFRLERIDNAFGGRAMEILDFGCGQGEFVEFANSHGRHCRGIDHNTELQLRDLADDSIDVINLVEVVEHLYSPREIFAQFRRVLRPGGVVYIETSIVDGHDDLQNWEYLDPRIGHCLVHSTRSLGILAESASLQAEKHSNNVFTFHKSPLDLYITRREGRYTYLGDELLAVDTGGVHDSSQLQRLSRRIAGALADIGPFYFHCGGAGDALLLLSTFYDTHPDSVVVSYPNSQAAMRSFFEAFPALKQVYFLPPHSDLATNQLLRALVPRLPNFRGMGVTPRKDYSEEWGEHLDIFRDYGVVASPKWVRQFAANRDGSRTVAVAPQGSLVGMAGTKRNIIEPGDWPAVLEFLKGQGYHPIILGAPNERETYPSPEGCEDCRSFSFREQMEHIAASELFVGADSWAKTFAALAGIPTFVFDAIKGRDWQGFKDSSDFVFLDPWECLHVVSGLEALKDCLTRGHRSPPQPPPEIHGSHTVHVAWEGTFGDNGSLSHVNRELSHALMQQPRLEITRVGTGHRDRAPTRTEVTVRHAWPPNWQRPNHGHWVLIQPWEYGALPLDWVSRVSQVTEIWVPSEHVRRVYVDSGVPPAKVQVVPNGVDPQRFHPDAAPLRLATSKSFKFLFVGGTIRRKGPDLVLKAFTEKFTAADDVCLVIKDFGGEDVYAGQTMAEQIRAAQAAPNAPEILYLTDNLASEAMPGLYTACDCLVHPYRGEGFTLPVLEAMACGLPVIVTAGGATDDFARDDTAYRISATRQRLGYSVGPFKLARPGWLLEPSFAELKERMRWVVEHRDEARAKGRTASEAVLRDWTWEQAARVAATRLRAVASQERPALASRRTAIELPCVARLGDLTAAHKLFREKRFREAWDATTAATSVRPFHPEARELYKQIKKAAGIQPPARSEPPRLSVCLIVKNEEKFLARCLDSVREVAWQIIVVDTGSTDRTKEIARGYGAEVSEFQWNDDFSAARNAALEHARGDWVLMLDADEELTAQGRVALQTEMRADKVLAYRLPIIDAGKEEDGGSYVPRLFRNAPGLFYVGRVHEQVFSSVEVRRKQWGMENRFGTATLLHHGYTDEMVVERNKHARNLRLLERAVKEMPDDANLVMNYAMELARAGRPELAVEHYFEAFRLLQARPPDRVVPELRESLLNQLCTRLIAAKRFEELVDLLHAPLAQHGGLTASLHFGLGLAYTQLGRHEEALEQFRLCLAKRDQPVLTPMNRDIRKAAPHHCMAICFQHLQQFDAAENAFRLAQAADPASIPVRFDYAAFLSQRGQPVEALKILHGLLVEKGAHLPVWLLGGQIALRQPRFVDFACDWTGEAIKHFPQDKMVALQRAEALLARGRCEEALPLWRRAGSPENAVHQAARILCELVAGQGTSEVSPQVEPTVSREFLKWYQRLLATNQTTAIAIVNERLDSLAETLPAAASILRSATVSMEPAAAC